MSLPQIKMNKTKKMLELAIKILAQKKSCPMWITEICLSPTKLSDPCPADKCWYKYLEQEASK